MSRGNKSLLGVPGRQDSGDSGTQVKFLSLGSERLELIPARTLPQAFVITPPHIFSPSKMVLELGQRLLAGGEVKLHSITDYCKCYA